MFLVVMEPSFTKFIQQVFRDSTFSVDLRANFITLIPKKESPELISQFRPIVLCNILMKIVSKVMSNRFKPIMPKLTSDTQSSFIPRRQESDQISLA